MKAALWHGRRDIRYEEFPDPPAPGEDELTIQVEWCGISETDMKEYAAGPIHVPVDRPHPLTGVKAPMILGHEIVGVVSAVGSEVIDVLEGDRVAPDGAVFCGTCSYCQKHLVHLCDKLALVGRMTHGGFAQYVNVPAEMCLKLPKTVAAEVGAFADLTALAVRAARLAPVEVGHTVAIVGASILGLLCVQVVKLKGASKIVVVESDANRRELAVQLGATGVIDPQPRNPVRAVMKTTGGGADVVIETSGNADAVALAPALARKAGCVVMTSLQNEPAPVDAVAIARNELAVKGAFWHVYDEDFSDAVALLGLGKIQVDPLISARIPLRNLISKGMEELPDNPGDYLRILVSPELE